jgi:membrane protein YdbS with pleckstrin-like domain
VLYVLFFIGLMAFMVKVSHNWWDPWPGVLILLPINIGTIWLIPKTKKLYIELYATKRSLGNGSDLSTKLLASEKEAMGKSKCSW